LDSNHPSGTIFLYTSSNSQGSQLIPSWFEFFFQTNPIPPRAGRQEHFYKDFKDLAKNHDDT